MRRRATLILLLFLVSGCAALRSGDLDLDGFQDRVDACPELPETIGAEVLADGCPDAQGRPLQGNVILLGRVRFEDGLALLAPGEQAVVQQLAIRLTRSPELGDVAVTGYSSANEAFDVGLALAEARARAVAAGLMAGGVAAERLIVQPRVASRLDPPVTAARARVEVEVIWTDPGRSRPISLP